MRYVRARGRFLAIGLLLTVILGGAGFFVWVPSIIERSRNKIIPHPRHRISIPAQSLHDSLTIADLHSDSLLWDRDLLERSEYGHVDIPRLIEGNVALQVFTAVTKTPSDRNHDGNTADTDKITLLVIAQLWPLSTWNSLVERALHQARKLHEFAQRAPDRLRVVRSADDLAAVLEARRTGKRMLAAVLGIEGAHALEGDLANLQLFYDAGYRMIGLTHFFDNEVGGSVSGMVKGGLTEMGRALVRMMEERGMIVDLAHASPQLVDDVLAFATRPVVVSHTGVRGTCDRERNLSDDQIKRIAERGGLIGIGYWDTAVCDPSLEGIVAAMRHVADLVGVEHVALGSDYDGSTEVPFDTSELPALTQHLIETGFREDAVRRIMGQNTIDFLLENLPQRMP